MHVCIYIYIVQNTNNNFWYHLYKRLHAHDNHVQCLFFFLFLQCLSNDCHNFVRIHVITTS